MNWQEFFHMGGYGFFVWLSYGVFLGVIALTALFPMLKRRSLETDLREQWAVTDRRKANQ